VIESNGAADLICTADHQQHKSARCSPTVCTSEPKMKHLLTDVVAPIWYTPESKGGMHYSNYSHLPQRSLCTPCLALPTLHSRCVRQWFLPGCLSAHT
jgi:hypothetical protein